MGQVCLLPRRGCRQSCRSAARALGKVPCRLWRRSSHLPRGRAEIDPDVVRRKFWPSISIGALSFAAPYAGVLLIAHYIVGWPWPQAQIAGISMSTTSVAGHGRGRDRLQPHRNRQSDPRRLGTVLALGLVFAHYDLYRCGLQPGTNRRRRRAAPVSKKRYAFCYCNSAPVGAEGSPTLRHDGSRAVASPRRGS